MSIVKHNLPARIMQKVVFENNVDEAISILDVGDASASCFGKISCCNTMDITEWTDDIRIEKVFGVRTFWGLQQNNEIKNTKDWQEKMF